MGEVLVNRAYAEAAKYVMEEYKRLTETAAGVEQAADEYRVPASISGNGAGDSQVTQKEKSIYG